jgi:hypothetical protein
VSFQGPGLTNLSSFQSRLPKGYQSLRCADPKAAAPLAPKARESPDRIAKISRSAFPNDYSVYRLIYLGLEQISRKWTMPIKNWKAALQRFAILYEDRLPLEALSHH